MKYSNVLSVLVSNHFGVLNRVTSIFSRRAYNIHSLTVAETLNPEISRITVLMDGDTASVYTVRDLLLKQEDVIDASIFPFSEVIARELVLLKVKNSAALDRALDALIIGYDIKVLDRNEERTLIQCCGTVSETDSIVSQLQNYDLIDLCRTGIAALSTDGGNIYNAPA